MKRQIQVPEMDPILQGKLLLKKKKKTMGTTDTAGIQIIDCRLDESIMLIINFLNSIGILWFPKRIILFLGNSY